MTKDSNNINIVATSPLASSNVPPGGSCFFVSPLPDLESHMSLLSERGLTFSTEEETMLRHCIESIGYYQFSTYLKHFYDLPKENKIFKPNTEVAMILKSYEINEALRQVLFNALLKIENHLKSFLVEVFTLEFQDAYWCDYETFASLNLTAKALEKNKLTKNKVEESYKHQATRLFFYQYESHSKKELPAWVVLQCQAFGTLALLLQMPKNKKYKKQVKPILKKFAVAIQLPKSFELKDLYPIYYALRYLRNVVVHSDKLVGETPHIKASVYDNTQDLGSLKNTLKWVTHLMRVIEPNGNFEVKLNQLRNEVCATLPKDLHF
jgi:abortive infection bacteriophage resistance protein